MDVTTHFIVPYAAGLAALGFQVRRHPGDPGRAAVALAVGLSGFAPDMDGALDGIAERFHDLYWLQHRGVSHTLVGAPVFALALLGAVALVARRWPRRAGWLAWRPAYVPAAFVGAWSHLLLDMVTYSGVPLLWPFAFGRVGFPLFHWVVIWLFPLGAVALILHGWGKLSRRGMLGVGAVFVAVLLVLAGARATTRPDDLPDGAEMYPRGSMTEWTVVVPAENGSWEGRLVRSGVVVNAIWFTNHPPPEAESAIDAARATSTYRGFLMGQFGPVVVNATRNGDAWNVTFTDVAQRFEALNDPRWTPTNPHTDWGVVRFVVDADGRVRVAHRGW